MNSFKGDTKRSDRPHPDNFDKFRKTKTKMSSDHNKIKLEINKNKIYNILLNDVWVKEKVSSKKNWI